MKTFTELAAERIIIFDGAMGTTIQRIKLPAHVWQGAEGNNDLLSVTAPDVITEIHRRYYMAGADVAVTNTFGANAIVLEEYSMPERAEEITRAAVRCAKAAREGMQNKYIALSVGPGSKLPTLNQIDYDTLYAAYYSQISAGADEGADLVVIETCQDLLQMKTAAAAAFAVRENLNIELPVIISFTVEENGATLTGSDPAAICAVLGGFDIFALGLNCGFGPDKMRPTLEKLARLWTGRLYLSPNAGMPVLKNGELTYPATPEAFAADCAELADRLGVNIAGGCCGTGYDHIKALAAAMQGKRSQRSTHTSAPMKGYAASAFTATSLRQEPPPALVGERANATGSKLFREKLQAGDYEGMASVAVSQEISAHIIDLSLSYSGYNEKEEFSKMVPLLNSRLTAPLMIDSVAPDTIEAALKRITGKPVVNSVNLEDGGAKLHQVFTLIKKHPAAVVALAIDEGGMARNVDDKVRIARRLYKIWTEEYGFAAEDIMIDMLTFPVSTGDEEARTAAVNTLKAIEIFSQEFPQAGLILGVSNVSFGLMPKGRAILNSVFLQQAVSKGLTMAIVHAEKVLPYHLIPETELRLAEALLAGVDGALDRYIEHFNGKTDDDTAQSAQLPPDRQLYSKVLKGENADLEAVITVLLEDMRAPEILSEILMPAMDEVGKLFGEGKLLLPFVLRSAEVMRKAADVLAPHLKGENTAKRGKLVLATVQGDVHDIGKNLVDIIFTGNGYEVINMGTKIPGNDIVAEALKTHADAIGMSGLLVKSVEIMRENVKLIKDANLGVKVLLGGAALTKDFVDNECSPLLPGKVFYCNDVFSGLMAMQGELTQQPSKPKETKISHEYTRRAEVYTGTVTPPFAGEARILEPTLDELLGLLKKRALFNVRWGYKKGQGMPDPESELQKMLSAKGMEKVRPKAVYGYYNTTVKDNDLFVNNSFFANFPVVNGASLAEHFKAVPILPLQFVTMGKETEEVMNANLSTGKYVWYYQFHGLFAALTEALADYTTAVMEKELHVKLRRYSFGYPACPDLGGNNRILSLSGTDAIGISINEGMQIEPVYSTAAFAIIKA